MSERNGRGRSSRSTRCASTSRPTASEMALDVRTKRACDPPAASDGQRVLIDHVWPRGIKRQDLNLDEWARELAPSDGLRTWFNHEPERFDEFRSRYRAELSSHEEKLAELRRRARKGPAHDRLRRPGPRAQQRCSARRAAPRSLSRRSPNARRRTRPRRPRSTARTRRGSTTGAPPPVARAPTARHSRRCRWPPLRTRPPPGIRRPRPGNARGRPRRLVRRDAGRRARPGGARRRARQPCRPPATSPTTAPAGVPVSAVLLSYDIALRDVGLMLAALTLGRLSLAIVPARKAGLLPRRPWEPQRERHRRWRLFRLPGSVSGPG